MRVLFFMRSVNYGRHFQSVLRTMLENGHELHIALDRHRKGIKSDDGVLRELKAEFPGQLTWALAERRRSPDWESFVGSMRLGIDYLRYRGPWFEDADLLRERARHRAPKGIVRLAEMPVVGGSHGRRALERVLRHLEAAVPIDVGLLEEVRRRDPAVVLVSPLVSLGSAQGDAVRAARAAGVPIALLVASWDNLTNKGVIRDDPDLTLVWNHAQVREGVELHGLREETIVAIGAHTYDHWFDWQPSRDRQAFCEAVGRSDMFEKWPGAEVADHARGNLEMQAELTEIFKTRTTAEWIDFGIEVNVPIAPIYTPHTVQQDPQFLDRMEWFPADVLGADQLPFPVKIAGEEPLVPTKAPEVGEHTDAVLRDVLGYDDAKIAELRAAGAIT